MTATNYSVDHTALLIVDPYKMWILLQLPLGEKEAEESSIRTTSLERTNGAMTGGINHSQVVFIT
ncbi:MAG: hypothetical protein WBZ20_02080, partial [Nitrososphaeraceae archaeon]